MSTSICPVCTKKVKPDYWSMCERCAHRVPVKLRRELMLAWRHRVVRPVNYQEALIGARQWCTDFEVETYGDAVAWEYYAAGDRDIDCHE